MVNTPCSKLIPTPSKLMVFLLPIIVDQQFMSDILH